MNYHFQERFLNTKQFLLFVWAIASAKHVLSLLKETPQNDRSWCFQADSKSY